MFWHESVCLFTLAGGGYPIPGEGGTPSSWWGYPIPGPGGGEVPPWPGLDGVRPIRQSSIASTSYAACGMPLAFTQEDFLVSFVIICKPLQVGFVVMSGMMIYTMYEYWPLNSALCTIWQVFDFAMCSVSILHLCLISFDRCVNMSIYYSYYSALITSRPYSNSWNANMLNS